MRDLAPRTNRTVPPGTPPVPAPERRAERTRLDTELVRLGLARSRTHAARLVEEARVTVGDRLATRPAQPVPDGAAVAVAGAGEDFASRAGGKLDAALDAFAALGASGKPGAAPAGAAPAGGTPAGGSPAGGVRVTGRWCLDAGASTGGFTDVLLRRGALGVVAVDVGTDQMRPELAADPRVDVREATDIRGVTVADLPQGPVSLAVADLSFISLTKALPALTGVLDADGDLVVLVKPQFEVGREAVGRGVVADPALWRRAVASVTSAATDLGWAVVAEVPSAVPGRAGNREFVLWLRRADGDRA